MKKQGTMVKHVNGYKSPTEQGKKRASWTVVKEKPRWQGRRPQRDIL